MPASPSRSLLRSFLQTVEDRLVVLRDDRPVRLSMTLFGVLAVATWFLSEEYWQNDPTFLTNVVAELHGVLVDLLLFGCLLLWLDRKAERRQRVHQYENSIEDLLGWQSEEALFRIVGNIRRLNREGRAPTTLRGAYLRGADLQGANLSDTSLGQADLSGANLQGANLSGAYLGSADFTGANLQEANLSGTHFGDFIRRNGSPDGSKTRLKGANLRGAILRDLRNAKAETFADVASLYKSHLNADLEEELNRTAPHLLDLPTSNAQPDARPETDAVPETDSVPETDVVPETDSVSENGTVIRES